jgi:hypothetical protein
LGGHDVEGVAHGDGVIGEPSLLAAVRKAQNDLVERHGGYLREVVMGVYVIVTSEDLLRMRGADLGRVLDLLRRAPGYERRMVGIEEVLDRCRRGVARRACARPSGRRAFEGVVRRRRLVGPQPELQATEEAR